MYLIGGYVWLFAVAIALLVSEHSEQDGPVCKDAETFLNWFATFENAMVFVILGAAVTWYVRI